MEQLYTWRAVKRDPRTRVISSSYMALVDSTSLSIKAGSGTDDVDGLILVTACWKKKSHNRTRVYLRTAGRNKTLG